MRYSIVKLHQFSGNKATVYSVVRYGEEETFLEKFIKDNKDLFLSETKDILKRLRSIGQKTGARIGYFKIDEGNPGDGVCALYDDEENE